MHKFRFGIQCRAPLDPVGWPALARKVEDLGYSTLTIADHLDDAPAPVPALMAAADSTTTLQIGTMVLCNDYRHPVVMAREALTLDLLSGGRFELGLGAGWTTWEYETAGIPMEPAGVRVDRLEETIAIVKACFAGGTVDHTGVHYRIAGLPAVPRPASAAGPTLVIGGGGPRVLRLAAREADIVAINVNLKGGVMDAAAYADGTPARTDQKIGWIRDAAGDRFHDLELQARVHLAFVTDDRATLADEMAPAFGLTPEEALATPHAMVGTVEEICDQLVGHRERWGISYYGVSGDQLDALAPVVARLTGT